MASVQLGHGVHIVSRPRQIFCLSFRQVLEFDFPTLAFYTSLATCPYSSVSNTCYTGVLVILCAWVECFLLFMDDGCDYFMFLPNAYQPIVASVLLRHLTLTLSPKPKPHFFITFAQTTALQPEIKIVQMVSNFNNVSELPMFSNKNK